MPRPTRGNLQAPKRLLFFHQPQGVYGPPNSAPLPQIPHFQVHSSGIEYDRQDKSIPISKNFQISDCTNSIIYLPRKIKVLPWLDSRITAGCYNGTLEPASTNQRFGLVVAKLLHYMSYLIVIFKFVTL